jgi:hypothetical protein
MPACAACGHENRPEARFCDYCGAALTEAAPSHTREERKVVTVLFCDLVGFTRRAEQLDPEDVSAFLSPYHERVRSELERHGRTVEKFIGDAVMALFGAPIAHEDDPERAIRAALAIRGWAEDEEEVQVRIAVSFASHPCKWPPQGGHLHVRGRVCLLKRRGSCFGSSHGAISAVTHKSTQAVCRSPASDSCCPRLSARGRVP